jgi:hypothetical protein
MDYDLCKTIGKFKEVDQIVTPLGKLYCVLNMFALMVP